MPTFTVLRRQDAYVDYVTRVEAETAQQAADIAYRSDQPVVWETRGVVEFDASHVVTLDEQGDEIESTARGRG